MKLKIAFKNSKSINHKDHKENAQRSQRNNNQGFTSAYSEISLCTLWLQDNGTNKKIISHSFGSYDFVY